MGGILTPDQLEHFAEAYRRFTQQTAQQHVQDDAQAQQLAALLGAQPAMPQPSPAQQQLGNPYRPYREEHSQELTNVLAPDVLQACIEVVGTALLDAQLAYGNKLDFRDPHVRDAIAQRAVMALYVHRWPR